MKTTLEIPDPVFRRAKSQAAVRGIPLRQYITEAVEEKLQSAGRIGAQPWKSFAGKLRHLGKESARINRAIELEFESVDAEEWR